jgi:putative ABC transport system substrate-binding protein
MQRRQFITLLGGATLGWPLAARAQQAGRVRRVGVLISTSMDPHSPVLAVLRQNLARIGYVEGRDLVIEARWARNELHRLPGLPRGGAAARDT